MSGFLVKLPFAAALTSVAVGGVLVLSVAIAATERYGADLPDHRGLVSYVPPSGSEVLASDGSMISRRASLRRTFVPLSGIPPMIQQAFISAEDKSYRSHAGVDPLAMARAGVAAVAGGVQSGASTITQQVAKNLLVGNDRSIGRKIREAILALRMDRDVGKAKILEIYLNEIYLGMGAYGVAEASRTFFGKTMADLDVHEAALIAAMPKAPSAYDPRRNPARALERRNYVIRRLAEDGYLTPESTAAYQAMPLGIAPDLSPRGRDGEVATTVAEGGWFEETAWGSIGDFIAQSGLAGRDVVVRTTLDPVLQDAAVAALRSGIISVDRQLGWSGPLATTTLPLDWGEVPGDSGFAREDICVVTSVSRGSADCTFEDGNVREVGSGAVSWTGRSVSSLLSEGDVVALPEGDDGSRTLAQSPSIEGALVAMDPRTGDVKALVGGFSHSRSVFDRVTQARRQPGSAFKPVVYLAALELGYDARSPLLDAPIVIEQGPGQADWRPADARSAGRGGLMTLRSALESSRNMASVRLLWDLGLADVGDMAGRLGVMPPEGMSYAAALGSGAVSPMQMALAYSTIANGGYSIRPRLVDRIEDPDEDVIAEVPDGTFRQTVDPIATAQMMSILRGVVVSGTARSAFDGFEPWIAGKTGTTNEARDVWFAAASRDLVVVAWIGRDDNRPLPSGSSGGRVSAAIVRDFLDRAGDAVVLEEPDLPAGIEMAKVDPATGLPSEASGAVQEIVRSWDDVPSPAPAADLAVLPTNR